MVTATMKRSELIWGVEEKKEEVEIVWTGKHWQVLGVTVEPRGDLSRIHANVAP